MENAGEAPGIKACIINRGPGFSKLSKRRRASRAAARSRSLHYDPQSMSERSTPPVPAPASRTDDSRRHARRWVAGLLAVCAAALWLQFKHIDGALPYPWDTDEGFVSGPASRTIVTGTLHP